MSSKTLGTTLGVIVVAAIAIFGAYATVSRYLADQRPATNSVDCSKVGTTHVIVIKDSKPSATVTMAHLCDTLTITNGDIKLRLMAFGTHSHHQSYDGVTEAMLSQGESMTVVLNQPGTFTFHDHLEDDVRGEFDVER